MIGRGSSNKKGAVIWRGSSDREGSSNREREQ